MQKLRILYRTVFSILCLSIFTMTSLSAQDDADQGQIISGKVIDVDGNAIDNANISVLNELAQVRTDREGTFSIKVVKSSKLIINKKGYLTVEHVINENNIISLRQEGRDQMVDVAYGQRSKNELTHAISSMDADDLALSASPNVLRSIPGFMSGLTILRNNGDIPGYASSTMYVRGRGTFGGAFAPLVLVDNVERDISELDPEEIESITVMKDAAATVLYGMEGANGVINVITKRGNIGKPQIKLVAQGGISTPVNLPDYLDAQEYLTAYQKAYNNDYGISRPGAKYDPANYDGSQDPYIYPNVNWYDEFVKQYAMQQQYKLSIKGGTKMTRYYILGGFMKQNGILNHTDENDQYSTNIDYKRFNIRTNLDVDITDNLVVSLDFAARMENRWMPNSSDGDIFGALSGLPSSTMPVLNADGSIAGTSEYKNNPMGLISRKGYRDHYSRFFQGNLRANYDMGKLVNGLSANLLYGYDANVNYNVGRSQTFAVYEYQPNTDDYAKYGVDSDIDLYLQNFGASMNYRNSFIGGFSYNRVFDKHKIDADIKYQQYKYDQQGNYIARATQGTFGRVTYGYNNKYIGEFGMSYSGSENFEKGNRFTFFPAASAAWVVSNESFLVDNSSVDYLKFRASYGLVGNGSLGIDRFAYEQQYSQGWGYAFGDPPATSDGAFEGRLGNPYITCEKSLNLNVGADFEAFNFLSISVDWFRNDRSDIITTQSRTFPGILGQDLPYENLGSVLNSGFETTLGVAHQVGDFSFFARANVSYAKNEVTETAEPSGLEEYQKATGKAVGGYWGLEHIGFFADDNDITNSPTQQFGLVQAGDVKYVDQNNDGFINGEDNKYIGNALPKWNMGLVLGAEYKGFDFNIVFYGVSGREVILKNNTVWGLTGDGNATNAVSQSWGETTNPIYPRLTTLTNDNNYRNSTLWIVDGDFIKLSNLEFGYTLPQTLTTKARLSDVRFYLNGNNLLSFNQLKEYNLDPETPNAGITSYPEMRVFNLGVSVKFK